MRGHGVGEDGVVFRKFANEAQRDAIPDWGGNKWIVSHFGSGRSAFPCKQLIYERTARTSFGNASARSHPGPVEV